MWTVSMAAAAENAAAASAAASAAAKRIMSGGEGPAESAFWHTGPMRRLPLIALACTLVGPPAFAAGKPEEGGKLVAQHKCEICHHNKTLGDAKAIYLR